MAAVLLAGIVAEPAWGTGDTACPVADETFAYEPYLPKTVAALQAGDRVVTIVAVGGASTEGRAASSPEARWPARFVEALKERYPNAPINLVVKAVARETAAQMAARFARDVLPQQPTLVIWETGTADAVRQTDIEEFRAALQEGIDQLRSSPTEIVLMDMQYSRLTHSVIYFNRYLVLMRGIADVNDIPLFPRHKIMYDWAEMGVLDTTERTPEARRAFADKLYRCIGRAMADFVSRPADASGAGQQ
jgi:lysophospholipase L1-like esterase